MLCPQFDRFACVRQYSGGRCPNIDLRDYIYKVLIIVIRESQSNYLFYSVIRGIIRLLLLSIIIILVTRIGIYTYYTYIILYVHDLAMDHHNHYQLHHHNSTHHYHAPPYTRDYFLYEYSSGSESDGSSSLNSDCDSGNCGKT